MKYCCVYTRSQLVTGSEFPSIYTTPTTGYSSSSLQGDHQRIVSVIDRWGKTTTCPCASRRWSPRASKPAPTTTRHRYARGRRRLASSRSTSAAPSAARRSRHTRRSADTRRATASLQRRHTIGRHRRHPASIRREPRRRHPRLGTAAAPGGTSARCATGTSPVATGQALGGHKRLHYLHGPSVPASLPPSTTGAGWLDLNMTPLAPPYVPFAGVRRRSEDEEVQSPMPLQQAKKHRASNSA
jgi:hypothetical protein